MAKFQKLNSINQRLELVRSRVINEKDDNKKPFSVIDREKNNLLIDALEELIDEIQNQNWIDVVFSFGKFIIELVTAIRKIRQILAA